MCVCVYIYMYIYIYTCMCTYIYVYIYLCMYSIYSYVHVYIYTYIYICVFIVYIHVHIYILVRLYTCIYIYINICIHTYIHVYMYIIFTLYDISMMETQCSRSHLAILNTWIIHSYSKKLNDVSIWPTKNVLIEHFRKLAWDQRRTLTSDLTEMQKWFPNLFWSAVQFRSQVFSSRLGLWKCSTEGQYQFQGLSKLSRRSSKFYIKIAYAKS